MSGLAAVGYSDDTGPRILAYLASMRPLRGMADVSDDEQYQQGRSCIERLAMSASGENRPRMRLTKSQCVDTLHFVMFSEPLEPRTWWKDPEGAPSHLVGYHFVLGAISDSMEARL